MTILSLNLTTVLRKSSKIIFQLLLLYHFPSSAQSVQEVIYDMMGPVYRTGAFGEPWGKHEAPLNGVPSYYDWADGARPGAWIQGVQGGQYLGTTIWGQVYFQQGGSPETNFRVQIRNLQLFTFRNNSWELIIDTPDNVGGVYFKEDFTGTNNSSDLRSEIGNGGGKSVSMIPNYNFHWWDDKWPRAAMPTDASAMFARAEVRLIPNTNPNVNLDNVRVLAASGIDAYQTTTSTGQFITSLGIPRHKFVTKDWQYFTFYVTGNPAPTTLTEYTNQLVGRALPPGVFSPNSCTITTYTKSVSISKN